METILNLVWLGVTLAVLWLWRFRWRVSRQNRRHSPRLEAVAVICFIALVFPVISLTDDLHPEIEAVDAVGGKRNSCLHAGHACNAWGATAASKTHMTLGPLPGPIRSMEFNTLEAISTVEFLVPASTIGSSPGRSPPAFR